MKPKVGSAILTSIRAECLCCSKGFWGRMSKCVVCNNDRSVDYKFLYTTESLSWSKLKLYINNHDTDYTPMGLIDPLLITKRYDSKKNQLTLESEYASLIFQLDKDTGGFNILGAEVKV